MNPSPGPVSPPGPGVDLDLEVKETYHAHAAAVYRAACRATLGDCEAAKDATQEAFIDAVRNWAEFRQMHPREQRNWLYACVRRRAIDGWRASQKECLSDSGNFPEQPDPRGDEDILGGITADSFWREIATAVPLRAARAAYLRWNLGWTMSEIARFLGVDRATVSRDLTRVLVAARQTEGSLRPEIEGREA